MLTWWGRQSRSAPVRRSDPKVSVRQVACDQRGVTLAATRFNAQLSRVYNNLRDQGKNAKVALVAVMRKLLILANTLIGKNRAGSDVIPEAGHLAPV